MNPIFCQYQLAAAVSNGLAQTQSLGAAGNLNLNGSLVSGGVGTLDSGGAARRVLITSAGNDAGLTWTVIGTNRYGVVQTESFAGANGAASSQLDFLTVTSIRGSAATASTVTAGTNGTGSTPWFPREWPSIGTLGVLIRMASSATVTVNFELTWDDFNVNISQPPYGISVEPASSYPPFAIVATGFSAVTQPTYNEVSCPHFGFRMTITSGTDPAILQVIHTTEATGGGY